jgi:spore photoproduct lyase
LKSYKPQKIYIEKDAADFPAVKTILKNSPDVPYEIIEDEISLRREIQNRPDPIGEGKRHLLLKRDKGRSFKPFPESEQYLSCDYFTLHTAEGCDLECSYCILQTYLTNPFLTVYVNYEEMLENLSRTLKENPERFFRIGTGQLADSLSLDSLTEMSKALVPFFARQPNAVLELKTKSDFIENLLELEPQGKTIVSWSMNSKRIQQQEEHKCASLEERVAAAKKLVGKDYRVGFHFDPIIDYAGWEQEYGEVLEILFSEIPEERIAWVSLGCLRFMPDLKGIMQERFPKSRLPLGEWITGMDGKMRYFKPRRVEIYQRMVEKIRSLAPGVTLYLSMESPEVWRRVFGQEPSRAEVCELLDKAGKNFSLR